MESEPEPAAPEVIVQPPSFIKPISNIVVEEGSPTYFEAVFAGEPEPEITWLRNGEPIRNTRDFKVLFPLIIAYRNVKICKNEK